MTRRQVAVSLLASVAVLASVVLSGVGVVASGVGAAAGGASTPTYVNSDVTADATWTPENGPYVVTGDITIESGAALTVEAGTVVQVAEEATITVRGSLVADGTNEAPVTFTSARPNPGVGDWTTIRYEGGSGSVLSLRNTTVEYAVAGVTIASSEGEVSVTDSTLASHVRAGIATAGVSSVPTLRVVDSRVASTRYAGIALEAARPNPYLDSARNVVVRGTTFRDTGRYGVLVRARRVSGVTVADSAVTGFRTKGVAIDTAKQTTGTLSPTTRYIRNVKITGTTVTNGRGDGISVAGGYLSDVTVTGNDVRNVAGAGIEVLRAADFDDLTVSSNTVVNAETGVHVVHRRLSGMIREVSMHVNGNVLRRNDRYGLHVETDQVTVGRFEIRNNTFAANGLDGALVTSPRIQNTVVAGNVARENGGTGIEVAGGSVRDVTVLDNAAVENGDQGLFVSAAGEMGGVVVADNRALDNAGVGIAVEHHAVAQRRVLVENNTVAANEVGVRVEGATPTLLANNSIVFNTRGAGAAPGPVGRATGVLVQNAASNATLRYNDIYGHIVGLRAATNGSVDAAHNYWGAESGPFHASINPDGAGNAIETDHGTVVPVPFASEPFGPQYERPQPRLVANRTTVAPGEPVRFTARGSTDDGRIVTYRFTVEGAAVSSQPGPTLTRSFAKPGTYNVSVTLVDGMGVESVDAASVTITVESPNQTTTTTTTTTPTPTTTTTPAGPTGNQGDGGGGGLVSALFSLWGALGFIFYLTGFAVGAYGVYRSMNGEKPPTRGRNVHAIAGVGVLAWAVGGLLGSSSLLLVGVGGAVLWAGMTAGLYVIATR